MVLYMKESGIKQLVVVACLRTFHWTTQAQHRRIPALMGRKGTRQREKVHYKHYLLYTALLITTTLFKPLMT